MCKSWHLIHRRLVWKTKKSWRTKNFSRFKENLKWIIECISTKMFYSCRNSYSQFSPGRFSTQAIRFMKWILFNIKWCLIKKQKFVQAKVTIITTKRVSKPKLEFDQRFWHGTSNKIFWSKPRFLPNPIVCCNQTQFGNPTFWPKSRLCLNPRLWLNPTLWPKSRWLNPKSEFSPKVQRISKSHRS